MKNKIFMLSDLSNLEESYFEDMKTFEHLQNYFEIDIGYFDDKKLLQNEYYLYLLGNTWPISKSRVQSYRDFKNDFFFKMGNKFYTTHYLVKQIG